MTDDLKKKALFNSIKVGDEIFIVKKWLGNKHNGEGEMDCYLGKKLIVSYINTNSLSAKGNYWSWFEEMIDYERTFSNKSISKIIKVME